MKTAPFTLIQGILVDHSLFTQPFACDLSTCHGACCWQGDAGAPLEPQEAETLRQRLGVDWPEMTDILCKLTTRGLLRFEGEDERVHIEPAAAQHAGSDYLLKNQSTKHDFTHPASAPL